MIREKPCGHPDTIQITHEVIGQPPDCIEKVCSVCGKVLERRLL